MIGSGIGVGLRRGEPRAREILEGLALFAEVLAREDPLVALEGGERRGWIGVEGDADALERSLLEEIGAAEPLGMRGR